MGLFQLGWRSHNIFVLFETDFWVALIGGGNEGKEIGSPCYIQKNQFGLVLPNASECISYHWNGWGEELLVVWVFE
jgi:hypothetical protein